MTSFTVIIAGITRWLTTLNTFITDAAALIMAIAGCVMIYYTILHLKEKIKGTKLDNKLKEKELNQ